MNLIDCIAVISAIANILLLVDRLRQATWKTVKPWLMTGYIFIAIWQCGILCYAPTAGVWLITAVGSVGVSMWLVMTQQPWSEGVPLSARSQPADLGPPELESRL